MTNKSNSSNLLKYSLLYIGVEGGLGHCCNAVDTKAILVVTPMFHPNLIKYPNYILYVLFTHIHCYSYYRGIVVFR